MSKDLHKDTTYCFIRSHSPKQTAIWSLASSLRWWEVGARSNFIRGIRPTALTCENFTASLGEPLALVGVVAIFHAALGLHAVAVPQREALLTVRHTTSLLGCTSGTKTNRSTRS